MPFKPKLVCPDFSAEMDGSEDASAREADDPTSADSCRPDHPAKNMSVYVDDDLLADLPPELQAFASQLSEEADELSAAFPARERHVPRVAQESKALREFNALPEFTVAGSSGSMAGEAAAGRWLWPRRLAQVAAVIAVVAGLSALPLRRDHRVANEDRVAKEDGVGGENRVASHPHQALPQPSPQANEPLRDDGPVIEPARLSPTGMPATTFVELSGAEQEALLDLLSETASMGSI